MIHRLAHLVRRFFGSLSRRPVDPVDDAWARAHLGAGEVALWERLSPADARHSVGVAREVAARLGDRATRPVVAAALLHDVGKVEAGLGTFGRVFATLAGMVFGRRLPGRIGRYLRHDRIGGDLLAAAGADPLTQAWAREHHRPPEAWTVPADVGAVLHEVDDD